MSAGAARYLPPIFIVCLLCRQAAEEGGLCALTEASPLSRLKAAIDGRYEAEEGGFGDGAVLADPEQFLPIGGSDQDIGGCGGVASRFHGVFVVIEDIAS